MAHRGRLAKLHFATLGVSPVRIANMKKLLALNRSEFAIRILRAANEFGWRTVGIYSQEDRLAPQRFKADEASWSECVGTRSDWPVFPQQST